MTFSLADLRGFNAMPLRDRNRFIAACETIENHEAANNEVSMSKRGSKWGSEIFRSEIEDERTQ